MCPRSEPSCSSTAQPRPLALSASSSPSQLTELDARAPVTPPVGAIHPALDGDEPEAPGLVRLELDEGGPHEVDRLEVPEVRLHDPPPTRQVHFVSPRLPGINTRLELCLLLREQLEPR